MLASLLKEVTRPSSKESEKEKKEIFREQDQTTIHAIHLMNFWRHFATSNGFIRGEKEVEERLLKDLKVFTNARGV